MFPYADPTGTDCLQRQGALATYRARLTSHYEVAAKTSGTKFTGIAALRNLRPGAQSLVRTVPWTAFPKRHAHLPNEQIDRERSRQEEYVEWLVQRQNGTVSTITFTTEFAAYFQALACHGFEALVAGIKEVIPSANPTLRELYGVNERIGPLTADGVVGPKTWSLLGNVLDRPVPNPNALLRRDSRGNDVTVLQTWLNWLGVLDGRPTGIFDAKTEAAVLAAQKQYTMGGELFWQNLSNNPWNTGQKGFLCLANRDNALSLLFGLVSHCATPRPDKRPQEVCSVVGTTNCVPGRSSDPFVCVAAQTQVMNGNVLSLRDPVGIDILSLQGIWRIGGQQIDINDPQKNHGVWQVSRGKHRAVLRNVPGLTLDGVPIETGAQVAKKLQVGADVVIATPESLRA